MTDGNSKKGFGIQYSPGRKTPQISIADYDQMQYYNNLAQAYFQDGVDYYEEELKRRRKEYEKELKEQAEQRDRQQQQRVNAVKEEERLQKAAQETSKKNKNTQTVSVKPNTTPTYKDILKFQKKPWADAVKRPKKSDGPLSTELKQQQEAAVSYISDTAGKQFDSQIAELEQKKRALVASRDRILLDPYVAGGRNEFALNARTRVYDDQIATIDKQLQKIKKDKDAYISTTSALLDPTKRFTTLLRSQFEQSDAYRNAKATEIQARNKANQLKNFGTQSTKYGEALSDYHNALSKQQNLNRKLVELSTYIQDLGYIPQMEEIPDRLKDVAEKAFTKDGKNMLLDKNAMEQFQSNRVVFKDEFGNYSKAVLGNLNSMQLTPDEIDRQIERVNLMRDYRQSKIPFGQRMLSVGHSDLTDTRYDAAIDLLETAKRHRELNDEILNIRKKYGKTGMVATSAIGFWDNVLDKDSFLNSKSIRSNAALYNAEKRLAEGKPLDIADEAVLQSKAIEQLYEGYYGDYLNERGFKWGGITAESLKFMAEFLATGGSWRALTTGAEKLTTKAAAKITLGALKNNRKVAAGIGEMAAGLVEPWKAPGVKQSITNELTNSMANFMLAKYGPVRAGTKLLNAAGRLGADAAYATMLAGTPGLPGSLRVVRDTYKNALGKLETSTDFDGNIKVDTVHDMDDLTDSLYAAGVRNWIENFSEMMGEWGIGKGLKWASTKIPGVGKMLRAMDLGFARKELHEIQDSVQQYLKMGLVKQNGVLSKRGLGKYIPKSSEIFNNRVLRNGQFHGFFGEVSEEYYGLLLQHAFGVQDDKSKNLVDDALDQSADIWGGIALSTGLLGAIGMGHSVMQQVKFRNAEQSLIESFGQHAADKIRKELLFAHPADIVNTYVALSKAYNPPERRKLWQRIGDNIENNGISGLSSILSNKKSQGQALFDYMNALLELRGAVYGEDLMKYQMGIDNWRLNNEAKALGYRNASYRAKKQAEQASRLLKDEATRSLQTEHIISENQTVDDILNGVTQETSSDTKLGISDIINKIKNEEDGFRISGERPGEYLTEFEQPHFNETSEEKIERLKRREAAAKAKQDLIRKLVAYNNSLSYIQEVDFRLDELATDRAKTMSRIAGRLLNVNDLQLHPLTGATTVKDKNGKDKVVETRLYLVDGDIQTSQVEGEEGSVFLSEGTYDSPFVLVARPNGQMQWIRREELKGWTVNDPIPVAQKDPVSGKTNLEQYKKQQEDALLEEEWEMRQKYLKELTEDDRYKPLQSGMQLYLSNGKKITVLDAQPRNNDIVFSVQNTNGTGGQIFTAKNFDQFKAAVDELERSKSSKDFENGAETVEDVTKYFLDQAEKQTRSYINKRVKEVVEQELQGFARYQDVVQQRKDREAAQKAREELQKQIEEEIKNKQQEDESKAAEQWSDVLDGKLTVGQQISEESVNPPIRTPESPAYVPQVEEDKPAAPTATQPAMQQQQPKPMPEPKEPQKPANTTVPSSEFEKLKAEVEQSQQKKHGASSFHYFVKNGDQIELWRRVHSEQTDQYKKQIDGISDLAKEIYLAIKNGGVDGLRKFVESERQKIVEQYIKDPDIPDSTDQSYKDRLRTAIGKIIDGSVKIDLYEEYLNQYLIDGKIKEGSEYFVYEAAIGIANAIPNVLVQGKRGKIRLKDWQSVEAGNIYDTINRYVMTDGSTIESVTEAFNNGMLQTTYAGDVVGLNELLDKSVFDQIVKKLFDFKQKLEEKGWRLYSETPMFLTGTLAVQDEGAPNGIRYVKVAGETDCIAVNGKGDRILIDFKTYRSDKKDYHGKDSDFYKITDDRQVHSTAAQYYQQFYFYNILANQNGTGFAERYAFLIGITYGSQGKVDLNIAQENVESSGFMFDDEPVLEQLDESTQQTDEQVHAMHERLSSTYDNSLSLDEFNKEYLRYITQYNVDQFIKQYEQMRAVRAAFILFNNESKQSLTLEDVVELLQDQIQSFLEFFTNIVYYDEAGNIANAGVIDNFINDIDNNDDEDSDARQALKLLANLMYVINQDSSLLANETIERFQNVVNIILNAGSQNVEGLFNDYYEDVSNTVNDVVNASDANTSNTARLNNNADNLGEYTIEKSTSLDGKSKLDDIVSKPDFVTNAEFYIQEVDFKIGNSQQYGIVVKYDGVEYTPVIVSFPIGCRMLNLVKNLFEGASKGYRFKLRNDIFFRSFGHIENKKGENKLDPSKNLAFNENLNEVQYSSTGNICITRGVSQGGKIVAIAQKPSGSDGKRVTVYTYSGRNPDTKPALGGFVYMYNPGYEEMQQDGINTAANSIPINLIAANITQSQAQFIVDYLWNGEKDNDVTSTGFQKGGIANLFIKIGTPEVKIGVKTPVHIDRVLDDQMQVVGYKIVGNVQGIDQDRVYSKNNDEDKADLVTALQLIRINLDERTMQQYLSDGESVVGSIISSNVSPESIFANSDEVDLEPGLGLKVSKSQVIDEISGGMSTIAWFMQNGLITSDFKQLVDIPIYMSDFGIENAEQLIDSDAEQSIDSDSEKITEFTESDIDVDDIINALLSTRAMSSEQITQPAEFKEMREIVSSIAGGVKVVTPEDEEYSKLSSSKLSLYDLTDEIVTEILGGHLQDPIVVGACYEDMIAFTQMARKRDAYHESFHRVLELLVPENLRNKAYNEYKKRFERRKESVPTDRQISEIAADEFAYFVQNEPAVKLSWNIKKMLSSVYTYYQFYKNIGSFTLWNLYRRARRGDFAKAQPTEEAKARFRKFAALPSSKKAFLASTINSRQIGDITEFVNTIMRNPRTYQAAGKSLDVDISHGANLNVEDVINSPVTKQFFASDAMQPSAKKLLSDFLGIKTSETGRPLIKNGKFVLISKEEKPDVREQLQAVLDSAVLQMAAYQSKATTNIEKQEREKEAAREANQKGEPEKKVDVLTDEEQSRTSGAIPKGEYQMESWWFEPITRASAKVKLFFSSVMDMEYQEVSDLDVGTSKARIPVYNTNDSGFPRMLDYKIAWSRVANQLYDVDSVQDLLDELKQRSSNNFMFDFLYKKFSKLAREAFEYETDKNGKFKAFKKTKKGKFIPKDTDKANDAIEIVSVISQAKTPPLVARSVQSDKSASNEHYIEIFDAEENAMLQSMKNDWSAAFASGQLEVMNRRMRNGKLVLVPNRKSLTEAINWFSSLATMFNTKSKSVLNQKEIRYHFQIRDAREVKNGDKSTWVPTGKIRYQERKIMEKDGKRIVWYNASTDGKTEQWKPVSSKAGVPEEDTRSLMLEFVKRLNSVGIMVSIEDIEWIIDNVYNHDANNRFIYNKFGRFENFIQQHASSIDGGFKDNLRTALNYKESSNISPEFIWLNTERYGFKVSSLIETLAKGRYDRIADDYQTSHLTINGKKQYDFGERNFIYDRLRFIQMSNSDEYRHMMNNPYYVYKNKDGIIEGSLVLKQIQQAFAKAKNVGRIRTFAFSNLPGMKTDAAGSAGVEYLDLSEMEDYMLKYSLLLKNGIILPTLSDKTTYGAIFGLERAFGFDWEEALASSDDKTTKGFDLFKEEILAGHYNIDGYANYNMNPNRGEAENVQVIQTRLSTEVLKQFLQYAKSEYISAKYELARVRGTNGTEEIESKDKVNRFHKGKKHEDHVVIQGARLSTFTGIFKFNEETGNYDFISFNRIKDENGKWVSEERNLQLAEEEFFSKSEEEQLDMMNSVLCYQIQKELDKLEEIGAISKNSNGCYRNVEFLRKPLGKAQFAITKSLNKDATYKYQDAIDEEQADLNNVHSRAIVLLVADLVSKSQMSMQESFRIYSGNLAYFKWDYDDRGILKDTTQDLFKRLGGLVSTGSHNVQDIAGIKDDIICAEVIDEAISTKDRMAPFYAEYKKLAPIQVYRNYLIEVIKDLENSFSIEDSDVKKDYIKQIRESVNKLDNVDDLKKEIERVVKQKRQNDKADPREVELHLKKVFKTLDDVINAQIEALGVKSGATVNDGAAYITDEMCKMLLMSIGKFNGKVKEAFDLLTSDKYNKKGFKDLDLNDALIVADAYNTITTEVIGTQKYMAYGQRFVPVKKSDAKVTLVLNDNSTVERDLQFSECETFYDKPAFFPLFRCIAGGHQLAVLEQMKRNKVDLLKVTGSMKVGNKGAVKCDQDTFDQWNNDPKSFDSFKFNTYTQKFKDFRKQFNTDPKGNEFMTLGTQYQKVVLSLLSADQIYTQDGKQISAKEMRNSIMESFNKYLDARHDRFVKRFYTDGKVDMKKLKAIMQSEISRMEASDPVSNAFDLEEVEVNGEKIKRFMLPIAAMSNTNWLQSVVASVVNKDLIDVVMPGNAFYQRSAYMVEGQMSDALNDHLGRKKQAVHILGDKDVGGNNRWALNHGMPLKEINEDKSMDIVLSIDFFDYIFNDHPELKYQSFDVKKDYLIKHGVISGFAKDKETFVPKKGDSYINEQGDIVNVKEDQTEEVTARKWHNATAQIVGYRIPTQAVSSIHAMRCVDVLPVVRDTVILPKTITAITGSDFDIDKFFLSTLYYKELRDEQFEESLSSVNLDEEFEGKPTSFQYTYKDQKGTIHHVRKEGDKYIDQYRSRKVGKKQWETEETEIGSNLDNIRKRLFTNAEMRKEHVHLSSDDFDPEKEGSQYYGNRLLKQQIQLLKTTDNNISKLHGAIDSDTAPLIAIAEKLKKRNPVSTVAPFEGTSLRTNVTAKMSFAIGKRGIGPFALNNNNHVLTYLYNVEFAQEFDKNGQTPIGILDILGLRSLHRTTDNDGRSILSWLSGLINAHVDVAKDPYIRSLGVNSYTYNLVSLLIRTGYGENTFWFTTQPIMEQLYKAYDRASGVYNQQEELTQSQRQREEVQKFYCDKISQITGHNRTSNTENAIEDLKQWLKATYFADSNSTADEIYRDMVVSLMNSSYGHKTMEDIATSPESERKEFYNIGLVKNKQYVKMSYDAIQGLILAINDQLQKKAEGLSQLVQFTKIDTKKQGITINEQASYYDNWKELTGQKSQFELDSITRLVGIPQKGQDDADFSFIGHKTQVAISSYIDLLAGQLFEATSLFDSIFTNIRKMLNIDYLGTEARNSISRMIVAKIKSEYFFRGSDSFCSKMNIDPIELIGNSDQSLAYKLTSLKARILNLDNHDFDELRDDNGLCNNYLLNNLVVDKSVDEVSLYGRISDIDQMSMIGSDAWEGAQFIRPLNIFGDSLKSSDMQNAWRDLLNSSNSEVRRFANELVVYAFMTSAELGGKYDLFKFVPPSWKIGNCTELNVLPKKESYASWIYDKLYQFQNGDLQNMMTVQDVEEMALDFYWDDNIVPLISSSRINSALKLSIGDATSGILAGVNSSGKPLFAEGKHPRFFKVRSGYNSLGQTQYDIYQVFAYGSKDVQSEDGVRQVVFPIYGKVPPLGGKYPGGQKIFQMSMNTSLNYDYRRRFMSRNYSIIQAALSSMRLDAGIYDILQSGNVRSFLNALTCKVIHNNERDVPVLEYLLKSFIDNDMVIHNEYQDPLAMQIIQDQESYSENYNRLMDVPITNEEQYFVPSYRKDRTDIFKEMNDLHLERVNPDKYSVSDQKNLFDEQFIDEASRYGLNIEFYKKRVVEGGKQYYKPTAVVSLKNHKNFGFFEVSAEIDTTKSGDEMYTNEYSVTFNTLESVNTNGVNFSKFQLSDSQKLQLFRGLTGVLKDGSVVRIADVISEVDETNFDKFVHTSDTRFGRFEPTDQISEYSVENDEHQKKEATKYVKRTYAEKEKAIRELAKVTTIKDVVEQFERSEDVFAEAWDKLTPSMQSNMIRIFEEAQGDIVQYINANNAAIVDKNSKYAINHIKEPGSLVEKSSMYDEETKRMNQAVNQDSSDDYDTCHGNNMPF